MENLDPRTTALVLIDLQNGIVGMPLAPHTGPDVVKTSRALAARFRSAGAPVVLVNVGWAGDFGDAPRQRVDKPMSHGSDGLPAGWADLIDGLAEPGDIQVTKRQWGAFYATDLDVQLRRRGVKTIVLGGIATNFGVESTARQAWERNYEVVVAEDATTSMSEPMHAFSIAQILPRICRIVQCADIELRQG
jgi:nicotinamidase-related amidase